ncbi:hypothetical protein B0H14DRAFT_2859873 [Mycena olivaceomarginata]|nr:hypothetical protein B0H14DRAFT_2859873 [Mycena olivaceomarginata]
MEVLGILGVAAGSVAIPLAAVSTATSVAGISQGASAQQAGAQGGGGGADPKDDPRMAKFSLRVNCEDSRHLDGKIVVLRNQKLYLDDSDPAHRTTISKDPPELNWIFADSRTLEPEPHPGPWDWTDDQEALMLDGWEGFVAMEEARGVWGLYYDRDEDQLARTRGKRTVVEISLERRVLKQPGS